MLTQLFRQLAALKSQQLWAKANRTQTEAAHLDRQVQELQEAIAQRQKALKRHEN